MAMAIALAERGVGLTGNNPPVGCVIVKDGLVIGRGWTQPGGRPHAEAMALQQAGAGAVGASAYVTLEPCAHRSDRGPCCASLLIDGGVAQVIAASTDCDPRTSGAGFTMLRQAGVEVLTDVGGEEARPALNGFFSRVALGRPFVTLKLATSLDGMIAMGDGASRWITGEAARAHAHLERARADAILVGAGTYRTDNPRLDVRLPGLEDRAPRRIVMGRRDLPDGWHVIGSPAEVATLDCNNLLVEGGAITAAAFLSEDLVDRLLIYRAPVLIGVGKSALGDIGIGSLDQVHGRWQLVDARQLGKDRLEVYQRANPKKARN